jgi:hypothetical protein
LPVAVRSSVRDLVLVAFRAARMMCAAPSASSTGSCPMVRNRVPLEQAGVGEQDVGEGVDGVAVDAVSGAVALGPDAAGDA